MDGQRFDDLAKLLVVFGSRRAALRVLAGGAVGALLARRGPGRALARACALDGERCSERFPCCPGGGCRNGRCSCGPDRVNCGDGYCRNLETDDGACGTCGNYCPKDRLCRDGRCVCPPRQTDCGGLCLDLNEHEQNCGTCGRVCAKTETCVDGTCACRRGLTRCRGACLDLANDSANCGRCGHSCRGGTVCGGGTCRCPAGTADCDGDGVCENLATDSRHCGRCRRGCVDGELCLGGTCKCVAGPTCGNVCCGPDETCLEPDPTTPAVCSPPERVCGGFGEFCILAPQTCILGFCL